MMSESKTLGLANTAAENSRGNEACTWTFILRSARGNMVHHKIILPSRGSRMNT